MPLFKKKSMKELKKELALEEDLKKSRENKINKENKRKELEAKLKSLKQERFRTTKSYKIANVIARGSKAVGKGITNYADYLEEQQKKANKVKKNIKKRKRTEIDRLIYG